MFNLIRLLYSLTAIFAGVSGINSLLIWTDTPHPKLKADCFLGSWFLLRGALGLIQVPVHLLFLLPARYYEPSAMWVIKTLLDNQPADFYAKLTICNYALTIMILLGLLVYTRLTAQYRHATALLASEHSAIIIWSMVWAARIIASWYGLTQQWFYLAWPANTILD